MSNENKGGDEPQKEASNSSQVGKPQKEAISLKVDKPTNEKGNSLQLTDDEETGRKGNTPDWISKANEILGGDRQEAMEVPDTAAAIPLDANPHQQSEPEVKSDVSNPRQQVISEPKEDLRTALLPNDNTVLPGNRCLRWFQCDDEACIWSDFFKCGDQWEKKPAKKYIQFLSVLLPVVAMIILQFVNSTEGNELTKTWCLRPRDKDGFGPLFLNVFFFWGWGDAVAMVVVYALIAATVLIRGNRVFLISSIWIVISYGLLYWGLAPGSDCQAGASTLNLGLAFFNIAYAGLEIWWRISVDYYALGASLVVFIVYLTLLFKNVIPDANTSMWAHLFSSAAGILVSIAFAYHKHRYEQKARGGNLAITA